MKMSSHGSVQKKCRFRVIVLQICDFQLTKSARFVKVISLGVYGDKTKETVHELDLEFREIIE